MAPRAERTDDPERREEMLFNAVPKDYRRVYKMRPIIEALVDKGSFFEMGQLYGRSIITGFARLDGLPVAVMAGDPYFYGGAWTAETCQKVIRFVDMAETFHMPVVYLLDCPGFLIGLESEKAATIRQGVRAMAGAVHAPANRFAMRYAWLTARWGSLPLEGGIEAAYSGDIAAAEDPAAKLTEIETRLNKLRSPHRTAEAFWVEEIIDPRDTRKLLCEFADLAAPLRKPGRRTFGMRP